MNPYGKLIYLNLVVIRQYSLFQFCIEIIRIDNTFFIIHACLEWNQYLLLFQAFGNDYLYLNGKNYWEKNYEKLHESLKNE